MADPPPDNGTEDNGEVSGRPVPPPAPLPPQVSPKSSQKARENDWMASDPHRSDEILKMDGDRIISSHSFTNVSARSGWPTSAAQPGTTTGIKPGAERLVRGDQPNPGVHDFSKSGGSTTERPEAPMADEESGIHAALVDEMKAHPDEGPLDPWLHSI
ncbi:unnamed protein product [Peronospora farinosa]|uniref:Uncharacterized protein n=1 Tax=Peronospora farinosa TaxID=134698 RepID=A0ABN8C8N7_9STRA|nr:unnamed protein product [Peronospora farinosa]